MPIENTNQQQFKSSVLKATNHSIVQRSDPLVVDYTLQPNLVSFCPPIFDLCADDALMSFCMSGTMNPLIDWLGFRPTDIFRKQRYFISYVSNEGAAAGNPISTLQTGDDCANCDTGPTTEWGTCDFVCEGFDTFKVSGPVRKDTCETIRYCEKQPLYTIDGSLITSNDIWDMAQMTGAMMDDFHRWIVTELERIVSFGYQNSDGTDCSAMNGHVIDLGGQGMCPDGGLTGVTYNGVTLTDSGASIIDFLRSAVLKILQRITGSPMLRGRPVTGDAAIVMPWSWVECLLDCYTCWTICGRDITRMDSFEARDFRTNLDGGTFNAGMISIHGLDIPIIGYDYELINPDGTADMYLLYRGVGNMPFFEGEFLDMRDVAARRPEHYDAMDNGMLLAYDEFDNECYQKHMTHKTRLCGPAPWAQVRFANVACDPLLGVMSCDPLSPDYITELNAQPSNCP